MPGWVELKIQVSDPLPATPAALCVPPPPPDDVPLAVPACPEPPGGPALPSSDPVPLPAPPPPPPATAKRESEVNSAVAPPPAELYAPPLPTVTEKARVVVKVTVNAAPLPPLLKMEPPPPAPPPPFRAIL